MLAPYVLLALAYPDAHEVHPLSAHHTRHSHDDAPHVVEALAVGSSTDRFALFDKFADKALAGIDAADAPGDVGPGTPKKEATHFEKVGTTGEKPPPGHVASVDCVNADKLIAAAYQRSAQIRKQKEVLRARTAGVKNSVADATKLLANESSHLSESLNGMLGVYEESLEMITKMKECLALEGGCSDRRAGEQLIAKKASELTEHLHPWNQQVNRTNAAEAVMRVASQKADMINAEVQALDEELATLRKRAIGLTNCAEQDDVSQTTRRMLTSI